ncbi:MAG: flagellar basal body rod protein FlgB [Syntrophomonadaceae bacterium]|nr:flagellar basal body rod protein FlgB [Syntrophomonadaceae bacterium]
MLGGNFSIMEKALEGATLKHKLISHNIANVNTPGFKSYYVPFQEQLRQMINQPKLGLKITSPKHIHNSGMKYIVKQTPGDTIGARVDGNNVDIDHENAEMAKNAIYYNLVINQINKQIAIMKYVDSEGRR